MRVPVQHDIDLEWSLCRRDMNEKEPHAAEFDSKFARPDWITVAIALHHPKRTSKPLESNQDPRLAYITQMPDLIRRPQPSR